MPEFRVLLSLEQQSDLSAAAKAANGLDGDLAEVGVFQGGSAAIILANSNKPLHLFDTFCGLPDSEGDFSKGQYSCDIDTVKANLINPENVIYYKGIFPDTAKDCACDKFSLVHIDCDLPKSVLVSLKYFYDKLVPGGSILVHDLDNFDVGNIVYAFYKNKQKEYIPGTYRVIKC